MAAVERLALGRDDAEGSAARVEGWEIHPGAVRDARARLAAHLVGRGWGAGPAEGAAARVIVEGDFLDPGPEARPGGRYTVCAANPPYLRLANLPERFKRRYGRVVPEYARADLLHAFLDRVVALLAPEGRLAGVTADRWLFNVGAGRLREVVGARFGIAALTRLDSATSFYRPKVRRKETPPRVHSVAVLLTPDARTRRPLARAPVVIDTGAAGDTGDSGDTGAVGAAGAGARGGWVPLGELAEVRLAPWLGPHGVFTLDAAEAARLLAELPDGERAAAAVPCVDTDDIVDGRLGAPRRLALRTTRTTPPHPAILAHLAARAHRLPPRARRQPLWVPAEAWGPLPWDRDALLVPRIARGLHAVRLPAGVLPLHHNLTVVGARTAGGGPDAERAPTLAAIERALGSPEADRWNRANAARLENGFLSITTTLLRRLPVRWPAPAEGEAARAAASETCTGATGGRAG